MARIERIGDAAARADAVAAIQALLRLHGVGLSRLLELAGEDAVRTVSRDPVVAGLLLLHGLHPVPLETRVARAVDEVRPYLGSHGGGVEVVAADESAVRIRLRGSCDGCPSSAVTVRHTIERAILEAAPEVEAVVVEEPREPRAAAPVFVPLGQIGRRPDTRLR